METEDTRHDQSPDGSQSDSSELQFRATLDCLLDIDALQTDETLLLGSSGGSGGQSSSATKNSEALQATKPRVAALPATGAQPATSTLSTSSSSFFPLPAPPSVLPPMTSSQLLSNKKRSFNQISCYPPSSTANNPISEDESERERRRQDRNMREQQRSQQITKQISHLRSVLVAANVPFEKADKFSTLVGVGDYIRQLQTAATTLDKQHAQLLATIQETSRLLTEATVEGANGAGSSDEADQASADSQALGIFDFKSVFGCSPFATAVTSVDGRFLDLNPALERLCGYERSELLCNNDNAIPDDCGSVSANTNETGQKKKALSMFNVVQRQDMEAIFDAMSTMLKRCPPPASPNDSEATMEEQAKIDRWMGTVHFGRCAPEVAHRLQVQLLRTSDGRPRYFVCLFFPLENVHLATRNGDQQETNSTTETPPSEAQSSMSSLTNSPEPTRENVEQRKHGDSIQVDKTTTMDQSTIQSTRGPRSTTTSIGEAK